MADRGNSADPRVRDSHASKNNGSPKTPPTEMTAALPVIDVARVDLRNPRAPEIARALDDAFRRIGFCYVANTGIEANLIASVFDAARRFHALSNEAKQAIAINSFHRGYIAPNTSTVRSSSVAQVTRPNLSESLVVMHEVAPDDPFFGKPLQGPNQWPGGLPGFREAVTAHVSAMTDFARRFTRLLALALGLPQTHLDPHFERPTSWLRLLRYPPEPPGTPDDQYGAAPHTDHGFITFLAQDDHGGLEVRTRDGEWIAAPPLPGAFVVNVADLLARWTNDRWTSTPHRVRNRTGEDRYSAPFFWDMDLESEIDCLPTCRGPDNPPRHEPVRFGDYVLPRLDRNYAYRRPPAG